jgi:hypothetical protein
MANPRYQEFKAQCNIFYKTINDNKMDEQLNRKATIFYNKVIYAYAKYSLDESFYIKKLQEAQNLIHNLNDPNFLKSEMDRLNSETIEYINAPLRSHRKCAISLEIISALMGIIVVAAAITATIIAPTILTTAMLIKGGISLVASMGIFAYFSHHQKNIEKDIHNNSLVMKESSKRQTIV